MNWGSYNISYFKNAPRLKHICSIVITFVSGLLARNCVFPLAEVRVEREYEAKNEDPVTDSPHRSSIRSKFQIREIELGLPDSQVICLAFVMAPKPHLKRPGRLRGIERPALLEFPACAWQSHFYSCEQCAGVVARVGRHGF